MYISTCVNSALKALSVTNVSQEHLSSISFQRCSMGLRSGLFADHSSSSTQTLGKHYIYSIWKTPLSRGLQLSIYSTEQLRVKQLVQGPAVALGGPEIWPHNLRSVIHHHNQWVSTSHSVLVKGKCKVTTYKYIYIYSIWQKPYTEWRA